NSKKGGLVRPPIYLYLEISHEPVSPEELLTLPIQTLRFPPFALPNEEGLYFSKRFVGFFPTKDKELASVSVISNLSSNLRKKAWTMSPEQSQYIWRKTIPHIEVGMGSGVFTSYRNCPWKQAQPPMLESWGKSAFPSRRKDSIQPQFPKLQRYDFTASRRPHRGGNQFPGCDPGGVYRARVHIHRGMLIRDY
ncbi:hypothetical protein HAX54_009068, partial [Datura stramonium]|nr:hypothetical protein [Datura stramonium]